MLLTHFIPGNPSTMDDQLPPASLLTITFPSSVPAYNNPNFKGDSASDEMVEKGTLPCGFCLVRSGLIASHDSPLSRLRKTLLAAMYTISGLCLLRMRGARQFQRSGSLPMSC